MANFFSSAPLDYGADYIYKGYSDIGKNIAGAASQIAQDTAAKNRLAQQGQIEMDQMKARSNIESERRQMELERQLSQEAGQYSVSPVYDEAGKMNVMATSAIIQRAKDTHERVRDNARMQDEANLRLRSEARRLGVPGSNSLPSGESVQNAWNTGQDVGALAAPFQGASGNLERDVYEAQRREKQADIAAEAKARAEASAPFREKYTDKGPFQVGGKYVGNVVRDGVNGQMGIMQNGQLAPLPQGAEPITATGLNKSIPTQPEFRKLKGDLTSAEISLRNMDRYIGSVGDADSGLQRLADNYSANIKTLMGQGLDPKQIALKMAQGQMQGLLGANRTNVVGGGVMTEQDALRIIERLGGDVGALSNPEVVKQAIAQVYSDRYKQYQDDYNFYNAAVDDYYGAKGFPKAEKVGFSGLMQDDYAPKAPNPSAPETPNTPAPPQALKINSIKRIR